MIVLKMSYDDFEEESINTGLDCSVEPSLTKQSFLEEVDINTLVDRFRLNGELPVGVRPPTYGDFTGVSDFKSAMDAANSAMESFMQMPADIRARFANDPQKFVEFCSNPENKAEAIKMGLAFEQASEEVKEAAPAEPIKGA